MMNPINKRMHPKLRRRRFTLMEMVIVVLVIGIVLALVGPNLMKQFKKVQDTTALNQAILLKNSCESYYLDVLEYPESLDDLLRNNGKKRWNGPYLNTDRLPADPWGGEFRYARNPPGTPHPFDITCYGADKTPGGIGENADVSCWDAR